ncbi:hypothetical protein Ccar_01855 [Clostridium carboxidivorans P7]|uniref:Uncharacterized protein n=1 Tax=Clostridium carboxidivorans P7 TaxID=536227 RepID=C6PQ15_9CLOT|nr:hypothetical protein [Clostridium carboxidivorans]AKN29660.1 hypothetical protein Ccar_01855 [Clostridium carboxidivorans P7]EET88620.1 hypothetical protein CcarbDRAFT_0875 [Clostridium carboxidivorans P7]EFG89410.1 hypothetical protein CLCAR_0565 [Clostridium carboxidivorans P7]
MDYNLAQVEKYLKDSYNMHLGENKLISKKLMKQLNRKNLIARSARCVYLVDNLIIKTSSDSTLSGLPFGAEQCINEFNLYHSEDGSIMPFKKILCPVYAIYKSKFIYLTIHKPVVPLAKNDDCPDTIYSHIKEDNSFTNSSTFLLLLDSFKEKLVFKSAAVQYEFSKLSTFGYDENRELCILDYGIY